MYNGSSLLANCFCGHCVIFPYSRIPEPDVKYYKPTENGSEASFKKYLEGLEK